MFLLGSAYPTAKLGINASMPPVLFGAIRMGIVFVCLLPFCKIEIPKKKYLLPDGRILIACYHPSPRNVNTKVVTSSMINQLFRNAKKLAKI